MFYVGLEGIYKDEGMILRIILWEKLQAGEVQGVSQSKYVLIQVL